MQYNHLAEGNLKYVPVDAQPAFTTVRRLLAKGDRQEALRVFGNLPENQFWGYAEYQDLKEQISGTSTNAGARSPLEASLANHNSIPSNPLLQVESPLDVAKRTGASYFHDGPTDEPMSMAERSGTRPAQVNPNFKPQEAPSGLMDSERFYQECQVARRADDKFAPETPEPTEDERFALRLESAREQDSGAKGQSNQPYVGQRSSHVHFNPNAVSLVELAQAAVYKTQFGS